MARRLRKMKSHEGVECVNLGERHQLDSRKLGERFVKARHVLSESSRGVIFERYALLKPAHNKLVGNSCACTRKRSEDLFPGIGTTSGVGGIIIGEHFEKGAEGLSGVLERFPKPVLDNSFGTKDVRGEKGLPQRSVQFRFLGGEVGPLYHRKLDEPSIGLDQLGQDVTAKLEQVTDTSNFVRDKILHSKILEYLGDMLVVSQGCESIGSRSGASDSSGAHIISVPSSRHSLESRSRCDKYAAMRGTVVDSPSLRSVQAQDVRRTGAREKVCCLPTRMVGPCWTARSLEENWQVPLCLLLNWSASAKLRRVSTTIEANIGTMRIRCPA
jgi:hypothetical protein